MFKSDEYIYVQRLLMWFKYEILKFCSNYMVIHVHYYEILVVYCFASHSRIFCSCKGRHHWVPQQSSLLPLHYDVEYFD